jgi:hypothetical protein
MRVVDNKCWEMTVSRGRGDRKTEGAEEVDGRNFIQFCKFNICMGKNEPSTFITTVSS